MGSTLLDASALLALIQNEPGAEVVRDALAGGAAMSSVNLAEAAARLHHQGWQADEVASTIGSLNIAFVPFEEETALRSGALRLQTAPLGLGLGDRACLATAASLEIPVLTADRVWLRLHPPPAEIRCIR